MAPRSLVRRLFWYSLALQLLLCLVYGAAGVAAGRGVAAMEEMLVEVYAPAVPIAFLIGLVFGGWDDIGVVLWAFPLIGATLYSLLLAALGGVAAYAIRAARARMHPADDEMPDQGESPGRGASAPGPPSPWHPAADDTPPGRSGS